MASRKPPETRSPLCHQVFGDLPEPGAPRYHQGDEEGPRLRAGGVEQHEDMRRGQNSSTRDLLRQLSRYTMDARPRWRLIELNGQYGTLEGERQRKCSRAEKKSFPLGLRRHRIVPEWISSIRICSVRLSTLMG